MAAISITGLAGECPGITTGQVRSWVEHRKSNGLAESGAIYRPHENRIYIDPDAFDRWLETRVAER